jgi:hypothetical protein
MSLSPTPTIYFNGINYNPSFYQQPTGVSLTYVSQNYLQRVGSNPTSIATKTTFSGNVSASNMDCLTMKVNGINSSSGPGSGAIQCSGGVYISRASVFGNGATVKFNNVQDANDYNFASVVLSGGLGVAKSILSNKNITSNGNIISNGNITCSGILNISNTTDSTGPTSGCALFNGGVGVGQDLNTYGNIGCNGILNITNTTNSTNYSEGCAVFNGGVGISGNLNTNSNISANGDINNTGSINSSGLIRFTNPLKGTFDYTNGALAVSGDIGCGGDINVKGNMNIYNGLLQASSGGILSGNVQISNSTTKNFTIINSNTSFDSGSPITTAGTIKITNGTTCTSTNTGALSVSGGVGVNGQIFTNGINVTSSNVMLDLNGNLTSTGLIGFTNTTSSTNYLSGAIIISGGVGIAGNLNTNGILSTGNTDGSTGAGSGAFQCSGGIYVSRPSVFGNGGTLTLKNTTNSTTTTNGCLILSGGLGIAKDIFSSGNINTSNCYIQQNVYIYNEAVINDGGVNQNFTVSGSLSVGGKISSGSQISCDSLLAKLVSTNDILYDNKIGGFLYSTTFPNSFPLTRTNYNTYGTFGININSMLSISSSVFLQPGYKLIFADFQNAVMAIIDNTSGTSPLYQNLPTPNYYSDYSNCLAIVMYYKNVQLNPG